MGQGKVDIMMIADAVRRRGAFDGWDRGQLLSRQLNKVLEEVAEAAEYLNLTPTIKPNLNLFLKDIGQVSRQAHDCAQAWDGSGLRSPLPANLDFLKKEVVDIFVSVCTLQYAIQQYDADFDLLEAAREKATKDISRPVRGAQQ